MVSYARNLMALRRFKRSPYPQYVTRADEQRNLWLLAQAAWERHPNRQRHAAARCAVDQVG